MSDPDLDDDEILVSDPDLLRLLRELSLRNRCILFGSVPKYLNLEKNFTGRKMLLFLYAQYLYYLKDEFKITFFLQGTLQFLEFITKKDVINKFVMHFFLS